MKKIATLMIASVALVAASCSSAEEEVSEDTNQEVEAVTYNLDGGASSLAWAANMGPDYGHEGTVGITEGTLTVKGDDVSGNFTIDMSTIKSTDLDEPKATYLSAHLQGTAPDEDHPVDMFFNVPMYPTVGVTVDGYSDGKLMLTLDIVGKELKQDVAAEMTSDENGASIKGDFSLDLTSLGIPGLQPNPEDGSQINPVIDFTLDAVLTK